MSHLASNPVCQAMVAVCDEYSVPYTIHPGRKHPWLEIAVNGRTQKLFFSGTPSDVRAPINSAALVRRTIERMTEPAAVECGKLVYNNVVIAERDQALSMTDMWRAAGSPAGRGPNDWLSLSSAKEFISYIEATFNAGIPGISATRGRGGGTFAHWQIGLAYAQYLNPAFHAWCNTVVRAHMEGAPAPKPKSSVAHLIAAAVGEAVRLLGSRIAPLEQRMAAIEVAMGSAKPELQQLASGSMVTISEVYDLAGVIPTEVPKRASLSGTISRSLNSFCRQNGYRLGYVKIGASGHDTWAADGARAWLASSGLDLISNHLIKHTRQLSYAEVAAQIEARPEIRP